MVRQVVAVAPTKQRGDPGIVGPDQLGCDVTEIPATRVEQQPAAWHGVGAAAEVLMSQQSERKPGSRQGLAVLPFPIDDPLASLPKTAQKILSAAQRLLTEGGYGDVTLEKVAAEAGVNKASIRYNFGDKAGFWRPWSTRSCTRSSRAWRMRCRPCKQERLEAAIEAKRRMILSTDAFRGFFDILPHATRNRELRQRIAALYPGGASRTSPGSACRAAARRAATTSSKDSVSSFSGGRRPLRPSRPGAGGLRSRQAAPGADVPDGQLHG